MAKPQKHPEKVVYLVKCILLPNKKAVLMHSGHDIFMKALESNRKVILTYNSSAEKRCLTKELIPVYYRPAFSKWSKAIYYFWDSAAKGNRMLLLPSSEIKHMELSKKGFSKIDYIKPKNGEEG